MKTITREVVSKKVETLYEAIDGTCFNTIDECRKYESTAEAVLKARFNGMIVSTSNEWDLLGGDEDHEVLAIRIKTSEDATAVSQYYFLHNSWLLDNNDNAERYRQRFLNLVNQAKEENDLLLIGLNYDKDPYVIDVRSNIINRLNNLGKTE